MPANGRWDLTRRLKGKQASAMKLFFMFTVSIATVIDTMDSVKVLPMYSMISAENGGMAPLIRVFGCVWW